MGGCITHTIESWDDHGRVEVWRGWVAGPSTTSQDLEPEIRCHRQIALLCSARIASYLPSQPASQPAEGHPVPVWAAARRRCSAGVSISQTSESFEVRWNSFSIIWRLGDQACVLVRHVVFLQSVVFFLDILRWKEHRSLFDSLDS
jgi:hypothetical protein